MSAAWSDDEVKILMKEYLGLLQAELSGTQLSKAEHNRRVQAATGRGRSAIEFKFCNLSAVMSLLGYPYVDGYKPRRNFQESMVGLADAFMSDKGLPRSPVEERPDQLGFRLAAREAPSVTAAPPLAAEEPWAGLSRLWHVATGGTKVAAAPDQHLDLLATGPTAPGTTEALEWFTNRLEDPSSPPAMLFLVGGPGAGKSHIAATLVKDFEPLDEADVLARRRYDYATGHSVLTVINDATIPSEESTASVSTDIDEALQGRRHLFACVNRGILVQDKRGTGTTGGASPGSHLVQWLINKGQEFADDTGVVRSTTTVDGEADVVVVYLDVCSLFEPRPSVQITDTDQHPDLEVGSVKPRRLQDRSQLDVEEVPGLKLLADAMSTLESDVVELDSEGVLHANLVNLSDQAFQRNLVTMLRCAELQAAQYFTYRELWGAISRALLGSLPREGDVRSAREWEQQEISSDPKKAWDQLKIQAAYRWPQALFDSSGTAIRTGRDPVGRLTLPADPARDARPGDFNPQVPSSGWATPVLDAFASQEESHSPLTSLLDLLAEDDPFQSLVTPFDERVDRAYMALAHSNQIKSDRAREDLGAWYGGYLTRLYAAAHGITAFMPAVNVWLEAWHMGPGLPNELDSRLRSLLRPRFNPDDPQSPSLLPLYDAKTRPVTGRSANPRLALRMDNVDLQCSSVGNTLKVSIIEQARLVATVDLDFPLVREALACSEMGHEGLTDLTPAVSPRLERIRSAHLTTNHLAASARLSVAIEDRLFQIGIQG